jgi:hypothetical protein
LHPSLVPLAGECGGRIGFWMRGAICLRRFDELDGEGVWAGCWYSDGGVLRCG